MMDWFVSGFLLVMFLLAFSGYLKHRTAHIVAQRQADRLLADLKQERERLCELKEVSDAIEASRARIEQNLREEAERLRQERNKWKRKHGKQERRIETLESRSNEFRSYR